MKFDELCNPENERIGDMFVASIQRLGNIIKTLKKEKDSIKGEPQNFGYTPKREKLAQRICYYGELRNILSREWEYCRALLVVKRIYLNQKARNAPVDSKRFQDCIKQADMVEIVVPEYSRRTAIVRYYLDSKNKIISLPIKADKSIDWEMLNTINLPIAKESQAIWNIPFMKTLLKDIK